MKDDICNKWKEELIKTAFKVNDFAVKKDFASNNVYRGAVCTIIDVLRDFGCIANVSFCSNNDLAMVERITINGKITRFEVKAVKLTDKEKAFCEVVGYGYIARDQNGALNWHERQPIKIGNEWLRSDNVCKLHDDLFSFIKWEDAEPWSVEGFLQKKIS